MTRTLVALAALALPAAALAQAPAAQPAGSTDLRATVKAEKDREFDAIDSDKNGKLSQAEIAAALTRDLEAEIADFRKQRDKAFADLDTDKNGAISKAEFEAGMKLPEVKPIDGSKTLAVYDKNKDKDVSRDEYLGPVLAVFDKLDANKDGKLTPAEKTARRTAPRVKATATQGR